MKVFNSQESAEQIIEWIKDYFCITKIKKAVIGISGGKDSSVAAALLVRALGRENVTGIMMPNNIQNDIDDSLEIINILGIESVLINIDEAYRGIIGAYTEGLSADSIKNIPPRIRMTVLYAVAQSKGALVCGTTNASEYFVGYGTKWGDLGCDFNPLREFTTDEVIAIGEYLGLPERLTRKIPADGLSDKSDEDALGVSYAEINEYIRKGKIDNKESEEKIKRLHAASEHKRNSIPVYIRK